MSQPRTVGITILLALTLASAWPRLCDPEQPEPPRSGTLAVDGIRLGMSAAEVARALGRPTFSYTWWGEPGKRSGSLSLSEDGRVDQVFGSTLTRDGAKLVDYGWSRATTFTALGEDYYLRLDLADDTERYHYALDASQGMWVVLREGRVDGVGFGALDTDYATVRRLADRPPDHRQCWHRLTDIRGAALGKALMAERPRRLSDIRPGELAVEPRCPSGSAYSFSSRYSWFAGYWVTVTCPVHHLEAADSHEWSLTFSF